MALIVQKYGGTSVGDAERILSTVGGGALALYGLSRGSLGGLCLAALGATAAYVGGAPLGVGAARVTVWGVLAMFATAAVGRLFGTGVK